MTKRRLAGLEERLERLIEGSVARLLGGKLAAQDVAVQLARAVEDHLRVDDAGHEVAPTYYEIAIAPENHARLLAQPADLAAQLAGEVVAYCQETGLHLPVSPEVIITPNPALRAHDLRITARHVADKATTTQMMDAVPALPPAAQVEAPPGAQLLIDETRAVPLNRTLYKIGRHPDNDLVLPDRHISRHHLQLRLRHGRYTLYDADSRGGTQVNGQFTTEHILAPGDVIQIGSTTLLYLEDEPDNLGDTQLDVSPLDLPEGPSR